MAKKGLGFYIDLLKVIPILIAIGRELAKCFRQPEVVSAQAIAVAPNQVMRADSTKPQGYEWVDAAKIGPLPFIVPGGIPPNVAGSELPPAIGKHYQDELGLPVVPKETFSFWNDSAEAAGTSNWQAQDEADFQRILHSNDDDKETLPNEEPPPTPGVS